MRFFISYQANYGTNIFYNKIVDFPEGITEDSIKNFEIEHEVTIISITKLD